MTANESATATFDCNISDDVQPYLEWYFHEKDIIKDIIEGNLKKENLIQVNFIQ